MSSLKTKSEVDEFDISPLQEEVLNRFQDCISVYVVYDKLIFLALISIDKWNQQLKWNVNKSLVTDA